MDEVGGEIESDVPAPAPTGISPVWKILGLIALALVISVAYVLNSIGNAVEAGLREGAGSAIRDGTVKVLDGLSHVK